MKRAIIFDFGNVLMKTRDYAPRHRWDEQLGLPQGSVERAVHNDDSWVKAQSGHMLIEVYWEDVARRLELSPDQTRQLAADFYSGDELDGELVTWIRGRRREGFHVALLSNDTGELRDKLDALDILPLFDPLVISAEIGVMKPDARAYQAVLDRLGLPAEYTILIDDGPDNVAGAAAMGIHAIQYVDGMDLSNALADLLYT